jgi:Meiotically up-regulated gene 113
MSKYIAAAAFATAGIGLGVINVWNNAVAVNGGTFVLNDLTALVTGLAVVSAMLALSLAAISRKSKITAALAVIVIAGCVFTSVGYTLARVGDVTDPTAGPLFADATEDGDEASGTIYVLRSNSELPIVSNNRDLLHKIGVTSGKVERRIANAKVEPTFLLAEVEIVATYELFNINRTKLENLIHRIFDPARLDIEVKDRFGNPVVPREWFLVPVFIIDEAVEKIREGVIDRYVYDPLKARLVETKATMSRPRA